MRPETKDLIKSKLMLPSFNVLTKGEAQFIHARDIRSILKLETELVSIEQINRFGYWLWVELTGKTPTIEDLEQAIKDYKDSQDI
ncbi:MAG: hypothetical protein NXI20_28395 [bacterium]|nr:hypothetical protein [bacterium]